MDIQEKTDSMEPENRDPAEQEYTEQAERERSVPEKQEDQRYRPGHGRYFAGGVFFGILVGLFAGGLMAAVFGVRALPAFGSALNLPESALNPVSEQKLRLLEQYIDGYYYRADEITTAQKEDGMYKGLVGSLNDVYSDYFNEKEYAELEEKTNGQYCGIGCYVTTDEKTRATLITGVMKGSPAETSGAKAGDLIVRVDGEDVIDMQIDEVVARIRGDEGTPVVITVRREKAGELDIEIIRARIDSQTVDSEMLDGGIGYLQLTEFDMVSSGQFREHLENLKSQGMKGLIIDLRGNLGGNVQTVVEIGSMLLPEGLVFYMEDRNGERTDYPCPGADFDLPLVVLVDGYSASASEILSGAVQDAGIGTIVGTQTYGKGVVQSIFPFTDNTAVKLTTADYYTRGGHNIDQIGITPDVEVELDEEAYLEDQTDTQLEKAMEIIAGEIRERP